MKFIFVHQNLPRKFSTEENGHGVKSESMYQVHKHNENCSLIKDTILFNPLTSCQLNYKYSNNGLTVYLNQIKTASLSLCLVCSKSSIDIWERFGQEMAKKKSAKRKILSISHQVPLCPKSNKLENSNNNKTTHTYTHTHTQLNRSNTYISRQTCLTFKIL